MFKLALLSFPSPLQVAGCSGYGIIGGTGAAAEEIENVPAISITLAALPATDVRLTHIAMHALPSADAPPSAWQELLGLPRDVAAPGAGGPPLSLVVLADPSFLRLHELLAGLE